jgi:DNA-binding LytR/AlgR family response regulator
MIRCLAVDDEAYAAKIIADYILKVPFLTLVGTTTNPIDALARVQGGEIDLVFLDIQMPEITGIQFLRLCGSQCKIILTTAYPEFALEGYEYNVVDYLMKPVAFERFLKAVQKVLPGSLSNKNENPVDFRKENNLTSEQDYLFVKGESKNKFLKIDYDKILYVEGLKNYVSLYTQDERIVTYQGLSDLETQLPKPPFYRVHKSYIVSIDKIRMIDGNTIYIQDKLIPIGDSYKENFIREIKK